MLRFSTLKLRGEKVKGRESSTYNIGRLEKMHKVKSSVLLDSVCGDFEMKREIARRRA